MQNSASDLRPGRTRANGRDTVSIRRLQRVAVNDPVLHYIRPLTLTLFQLPKVSKHRFRVVNSETAIKFVEIERLSLRTF